MAAKLGQKTLYAECDPALHEAVVNWQSEHDNAPMKQCILGGVKIFLALPDVVQGILIACQRDSSVIKQIGDLVSRSTISISLRDNNSDQENAPLELISQVLDHTDDASIRLMSEAESAKFSQLRAVLAGREADEIVDGAEDDAAKQRRRRRRPRPESA